MRWMCQSRLGCPTQKKTWHTCMLLWYAMISLVSSWSQFYGWAHIRDYHSLVFSHLYWAVLYHLAFCLVSFCLHLVLILINDTPPCESNKSKRSCSTNYSHGLHGTLPLCVNEQALWAEVSWFCWGMWRSAIKTRVGPSSRALCNNKPSWFYMPVKALFHTRMPMQKPWS